MVAGILCLEFLLQLNLSMACAILHSSEKFRFRFSSTSPYKKNYMPRRAVYELVPASRVVLRICVCLEKIVPHMTALRGYTRYE